MINESMSQLSIIFSTFEVQDENGGQQKPVTHPTLMAWWALKTRYPPYI